MRLLRQRRSASTYVILLAMIFGVGYAMATADEYWADGRTEVVIPEEQKTEFFAYVRRRNIQPSSFTGRVAVGDRLPDFGVTYYVLPIRYGHPFYRYASVGPQILIVDRLSGAVVQVLD
jgi:hypothetical protein